MTRIKGLDFISDPNALPWVKEMEACQQDPGFHEEGDVLTHTRMVWDAVARIEAFARLTPKEREMILAACLLHDIGKPLCTIKDPRGAIVSKGHSKKGARLTRAFLMERRVPFKARETIVNMVRLHSLPFHDQEQVRILAASFATRCDLLALLAEADARGREYKNKQDTLDQIELFRESCKEMDCYDHPKPFPTDHTRFAYFKNPKRSPDIMIHDPTEFEVIVLSGLPGAGKDHWVEKNAPALPMVSLDRIRKKLKIPPQKNQGQAAQYATKKAKELLRNKTSFVWNATNTTKQARNRIVDLCAAYGARIRMVYIEPDLDQLLKQNQNRVDRVPQKVIFNLLHKLEIPDMTEAHSLETLT